MRIGSLQRVRSGARFPRRARHQNPGSLVFATSCALELENQLDCFSAQHLRACLIRRSVALGADSLDVCSERENLLHHVQTCKDSHTPVFGLHRYSP